MKMLLLTAVALFVLSNRVDAQINQYSQPARQPIINTHAPQNLELMRQVLEAKQAQYDADVESCQKQTLEMYEAAGNYPATSTLLNGTHNATVMTSGLCANRKVFIKDGKVESMIHESGSTMPFVMSTLISNGKCMATRQDPETRTTIYYKVYLMEDIFSK